MTSYYTTIPAPKVAPRSGYYDGEIGLIHMPDSVTVFEQDASPTHTGLLNAHGEPLYRVEERLKLGFHLK